MMTLSTILLALSMVTAVWGQCRPNWHQHLESCYGFGEQPFPWTGAEDVCRAYGAKLAEIETEEENNFLKSQLKTMGGVDYWIGGSDIFSEGSWEWVSTSEPFYPFSDWVTGQPAGQTGESCLVMDHDFNFQWQDFPCTRSLHFICESSLESVVG